MTQLLTRINTAGMTDIEMNLSQLLVDEGNAVGTFFRGMKFQGQTVAIFFVSQANEIVLEFSRSGVNGDGTVQIYGNNQGSIDENHKGNVEQSLSLIGQRHQGISREIGVVLKCLDQLTG